MINLLKQNIAKHIALSSEETEQFCNLFTQHFVKKKDFMLREGDTCKFEAFVIKGLFSIYHTDQNGFGQVLFFSMENLLIADVDSFTHQKRSNLFFLKL